MTVDGHSSLYNYSSSGDLSVVHFASGLSRIWTYDEMNLLNGSSVFNADGDVLASIGLSHNWNGRVVLTTKPQNVTIELLYDTSGKVIASASPGDVWFMEVTSVIADSTIKSYMFGDQVSIK